jgi:NitT/TauT family transport system permease protein
MSNTRNVSLSILLLVVSLALWEGVVRFFDVPVFILPAPSKVAVALYRGLESGLYLTHLKVTLLETIFGFIAGSALGFLPAPASP